VEADLADGDQRTRAVTWLFVVITKKPAKLSSQNPQRVSESIRILIGGSRRKNEVVTFYGVIAHIR